MNRQCLVAQFVLFLAGVVCCSAAWADIDDTLWMTGQQRYASGYVTLGYATAPDDNETTQRALPYSEQRSYPALDVESFWARKGDRLRADAMVRGEKDYLAEFFYDKPGSFRLTLLDESLFHRLDHLPLPAATPDGQIITSDTDPAGRYALQFRQQAAALRFSPKLLPSHVTVRYHRIMLDGERQLRFLDENCTSQCHIVSRGRPVDQETEEFFGMLDAHLGPLEVSLDHLHRAFDNQAPNPTDPFAAGTRQHDVLPDNRYDLTTVRIHNSLAGGLVAAGSLSAGKRTNESEQVDIEPIHAETDIFRAAGDLAWTPSPLLQLAFRYRITRIDKEVGAAFTSPVLDLPEAIDVSKNTFGATAVVTPSNRMMFKGDYQHDQIRRDHVAENSFWAVPQEEDIDRFGLDLRYRPFGRSTTRFDLGYHYTRSSDPAYAMANENTHMVKASARIAPASNWGAMATVRAEEGENGGVTAPLSTGQVLFDRTSRKGDATLNAWLSPTKRLTVGGTLGYSDLLVEQDLRFGRYGGTTDVVARDVESRQIVRSAAFSLSLALTRKLGCTADLHHVRGSYHYAPEFADLVVGDLLTAAGLSDIGSIELVQNGFSTGLNWQVRERLSVGLRYLYDAYHDQRDERLDATVQSYMASVTRTW